jgi:hypothetical protein
VVGGGAGGGVLQLQGVSRNQGGQSIDENSHRKVELTKEVAAAVPHPNPVRWVDLQ